MKFALEIATTVSAQKKHILKCLLKMLLLLWNMVDSKLYFYWFHIYIWTFNDWVESSRAKPFVHLNMIRVQKIASWPPISRIWILWTAAQKNSYIFGSNNVHIRVETSSMFGLLFIHHSWSSRCSYFGV